MAFWSNWFKPTCPSCQCKISEQPIEFEDQRICATCHASILSERARQATELEARRRAEEEARAKVEGRQVWGPRG